MILVIIVYCSNYNYFIPFDPIQAQGRQDQGR